MVEKTKKSFLLNLASIGILSLSQAGCDAPLAAVPGNNSPDGSPQPTHINHWRARNNAASAEQKAEQKYESLNQQAEELNEKVRNSDAVKIAEWAEKPTKIYSLEDLDQNREELFETAKAEMTSGKTDQTMYNILNSLSFYQAAQTARQFLALPAPAAGQHYDYCTIQKLNLDSSSAQNSAGQSNGDQPEQLASPNVLRETAQAFVTSYQDALSSTEKIPAMLESVRTLAATAQDLDFNYPGQKPAAPNICPKP